MDMGLVYYDRKSKQKVSEALGARRQHQLTREAFLFREMMSRQGFRAVYYDRNSEQEVSEARHSVQLQLQNSN